VLSLMEIIFPATSATENMEPSGSDFANALKAAGVRETFIAGCSSVSFAAGVFPVAPSIRAGGLYFDRNDDAKGNANAVIDLRIQKQPIKWWELPGGR